MARKTPSRANTTQKAVPATKAIQPNDLMHPHQGIELKPAGGSNRDAITKRAYEIYLDRQQTGKPGSETSDWLQAERELR